MSEKKHTDSNGVDLILNAIYTIVIALSYLLITDTFREIDNGGDYKTVYVSCLILIIPCVLDGVKELLNYMKKQKLYVNIFDLVFGILSFLIAASLIFAIFRNNNERTFACIIVYGSIVCVCSYATHFTSALIDACRMKFGKEV